MSRYKTYPENRTIDSNLKSSINIDEYGIKIFEDSTQVYGTNDVFDTLNAVKNNYSEYDNQTNYPEYSNFTTDDYCASNYSHIYLNVTCEFPISYAEPMYG